MSVSKMKCWYSNNCLNFLKGTVPFNNFFTKSKQITKNNLFNFTNGRESAVKTTLDERTYPG